MILSFGVQIQLLLPTVEISNRGFGIWARGTGTIEEQFTNDPQFEGLNPATSASGRNQFLKIWYLRQGRERWKNILWAQIHLYLPMVEGSLKCFGILAKTTGAVDEQRSLDPQLKGQNLATTANGRKQ